MNHRPHPEERGAASRLEGWPRGRRGFGASWSALRGRFATPQRLCWRSSVFWSRWLFVSQDGVEDGEEFAGCRDGDKHFGLAGVDEALAKGLEDGVVTAGGEACEKEGGAHGLAAAGDHGLALPLAGVAGERGEAGQACDLLAVERAELRQLGDEGARARDGGEQVFLVAPCGRSADARIDFCVDLGELLLERGDQAGDALFDALDRDAPLAIALGDDHLNDLAAPRDEVGKQLGRFVGEWTQVRLGRLDEAGDPLGGGWV